MKNNIKLLSIFIMMFMFLSVTSCKIESADDFSDMKIIYEGSVNSLTVSDVDELYRIADYVIVASPTQTIYEAEQVWCDDDNNLTEDFSSVAPVYSYIKRNYKINKVYKGTNLKLKEITICESLAVNDNEIKALPGDYAVKKGNKYLLFVGKSNIDDNLYFPILYQGKYDLEEDNEKNAQVDKKMLKQVKEKYKEDFK